MRVCSICGERNEDWMEICQRCGNSIVNADSFEVKNENKFEYETVKKEPKKKFINYEEEPKKPIANLDLKIIIIILLIILIALIVYTIYVIS